jgi:uncharacterized protein (TIGR02145 family)
MKKLMMFIFVMLIIKSQAQIFPQGLFRVGKAADIVIGTQIWMSANLDTRVFANGDTIPTPDKVTLVLNNDPGSIYYNNDSINYKKYGRLYNWYAVNDPRGLCPAGYHVPTDADWQVLSDFVGGDGNKLKEAGTTNWYTGNTGTNTTKFTALPGGYMGDAASYSAATRSTYLWSATSVNLDQANRKQLDYFNGAFRTIVSDKNGAFSVRCIKNQ